jgi:hypothetical protein
MLHFEKGYILCWFAISAIAKTAQFVVIKGKNIPNALNRAGLTFFTNISTSCTVEAMTTI